MKRKGAKVALSQAVGTYLSELSVIGRSPKTVHLQRDILRIFVREIGGERQLASVNREDVTAYLGRMRARGLSQSYVGTSGKTVKRLLNWAVEQNILEVNPLQGMAIRMGPDKPISPFTDDECQRLIRAADTPLKRAALLLLMDSGLRASELTSLRLRDIDFAANEITVIGKGGRARKIALTEQPRQALAEYMTSRPQQDGYLWPAGWDRGNLETLMDAIGRQAGVYPHNPHRFRHNWGARMRRAGVDAIHLQRLLGHSSLKMTLRYVAYVEGECAVEAHKQHSIIPAA